MGTSSRTFRAASAPKATITMMRKTGYTATCTTSTKLILDIFIAFKELAFRTCSYYFERDVHPWLSCFANTFHIMRLQSVQPGITPFRTRNFQLPTSNFQLQRVNWKCSVRCIQTSTRWPLRNGSASRSWNLAKPEVPHTELPEKATLKF